MLNEFSHIFAFMVLAVAFVAGGILTNRILRRQAPTSLKLDTYECGEEPVGAAWQRFTARYYVVALVFLIFAVEIVFLFPWALVFRYLGWLALIEMFIFLAILVLGFAYVWSRGDLDWVRPEPVLPSLDGLLQSTRASEEAITRMRNQKGVEI